MSQEPKPETGDLSVLHDAMRDWAAIIGAEQAVFGTFCQSEQPDADHQPHSPSITLPPLPTSGVPALDRLCSACCADAAPLADNALPAGIALRLSRRLRKDALENVLVSPLQLDEDPCVLVMLFNKPGGFTEDDLAVSARLSRLVSVTLANARSLTDLAVTEERLRFALEGSKAGTWDWNLQTDEVTYDEGWAAMLGYRAEDLRPRLSTWEDLVHPDDLVMSWEQLNRHMRGETDLYYQEHRMRTSDGGWKWIVGRGRVVERSEDGRPLRAVGIHLDITERKLAEEALRESERRFYLSLELASDAIFLVSDDRWTYVNAAGVELLGAQSRDALIGTPYLERIHPEYRELVARRLHEIDPGPTAPRVEIRLLRMDGSTVEVETSSALIPLMDGTVRQFVARDITERKKAQAALAESEERYRTLIESSPLPVFVNRHDRVVFVNQSCVRLFDANKAEDLLGKSIYEMFDEQHHDLVRQRVERMRSTGLPAMAAENKVRRLDGTFVPVEVAGAPFQDGNDLSIHVVLLDITERKQAETELERQQRQLAKLTSELLGSREQERRRIAMELHDGVAQALAAAKMGVQQMGASEDGCKEDLAKVVSALDYSISGLRLMTSELSPPVLHEYGLGAALQWLASTMQSRYGLKVRVDIDPCANDLKNDAAIMLFRSARELLNNVHRHAGVNEAKVRVATDDEWLILAVSDKGCGFIPITEERDPEAHFGLSSIIKEVHFTGGSTEINSAVGRGTRVELSVPLQLAWEGRRPERSTSSN